LKRKMAERNPGSSDLSGDSTSASVNSLDQTTINLSVSSVVFGGRRLIWTEQGPAVNAPDAAGALLAPASPAKGGGFAVALDRAGYGGCAPLEGRKAWPDWEKDEGFMACCGV
jgi:hypothetical protein